MGRRNRSSEAPASSAADAAIILLTTDFGSSVDVLLEPLLSKLQHHILEIQRQHSKATPATPANGEVSAQRGIPTTLPSIASEGPSELPSGLLGAFLFRLLVSLPETRKFFAPGKDKVIAQVFEQSDSRVEVLRYFHVFRELKSADKFRRLLADRSLALSHERYHDGAATVPDFAATLKLKRREDIKLAIDGTYRGKAWRKLEQSVGVPGISAVVCFEHTLWKKNVRANQIKEFKRLLGGVTFAPILQLAREVSSLLEGSQHDFDAGPDSSASAGPVDGNLEPISTHRVMEQPNPASCAALGDSSHYFSAQGPRSMEGDNAGHRSPAALENAPTQLYFDHITHNMDTDLINLWSLEDEQCSFPPPAS